MTLLNQIVALYRGFSLHEYRSRQTTKLVDVELIKMNLLTHIYTLKGERLAMANFGTRIPELAFEPLTQEVLDIIREDLEMVCNYDPRVELESLDVIPEWETGIVMANMKLRFVELNVVDTLALTIEFEQ